MPSERIKGLIRRRDEGVCWHCGTDSDTTIHHHQNRGMGGKKAELSDRPSNLLTICQHFNFLMEADADAAREAREKGLKLKQSQSPEYAHIVKYDGTIWMLDDLGAAHRLKQNGLI